GLEPVYEAEHRKHREPNRLFDGRGIGHQIGAFQDKRADLGMLLKDSIAWLKVPAKPHLAEGWIRNVFANGDARGGSHYMGVGDVDGDGFPEIAVGAKGAPFEDGNWFAFWKHPGAGSSDKPWQKQMLAIDQVGATNVAGVDLNGDGRVDWAATRGHGRGVLWFENPTWKMRVIDPDLASPHSLAVGDFDDDGDMDLASCGFLSERVMWYQNDGRGQFDLHVIDTQQESYDLRSVDMDGDGDLDLLNAGRATQNVVWYENR
ncbi:MAG: FG-GAP repeat protein, partial [Planctomycetota bacterium]